jgi:hypothetical protein
MEQPEYICPFDKRLCNEPRCAVCPHPYRPPQPLPKVRISGSRDHELRHQMDRWQRELKR